MAYEKQTWSCGETITADKLNHMEDGIMESGGGSTLVVNYVEEDGSGCSIYDKTWQEVFDALAAGKRCIVVNTNDVDPIFAGQYVILDAIYDSAYVNPYMIHFITVVNDNIDVDQFIAESANSNIKLCYND